MALAAILFGQEVVSSSLDEAWQSLTGFGDDVAAPSLKIDVPVSDQKNNCFQVS